MNQNAKAGPDFYDDDEVFATYARRRRSADSPNERLLQFAGFRLDALREAHPRREHFQDESTYARRMRIPLFLIKAAHKGA